MSELKESNHLLKVHMESAQSKPNDNLEESCKEFSIFYQILFLCLVRRIDELMRVTKNLKDRNDELEFCLLYRTERGRTRKRGRRTSR